MKVISLLGSTGSIGTNTLRVTSSLPKEFRVAGLSGGKNIPLLASQIEHISVLNPLKDLKKGGFDLTLVPMDSMGIIDLAALESQLSKETVLTSVMYANSDIGTIQPIKEVSDLVHEKGLFLHVDAAAAAGKIAVDVQKDGIDMLTLSSNDLYGPQGAGACRGASAGRSRRPWRSPKQPRSRSAMAESPAAPARVASPGAAFEARTDPATPDCR